MSSRTRSSFLGVQASESRTSRENEGSSSNAELKSTEWPPYDTSDIKSRIDNVVGPLSLFAPFPHEDEPETTELELERPNTPIDKEIKVQPSSFDVLSQFIRRRIAPKPGVMYLSYEDQQNLAGIIMGEVNGIWPDIRKQIDDPFLTAVQNKELNRRIAVTIVTECEKLFNKYLQKAQILNSRGVFSGPANMSRLKAQLALEINNFLNILRIRRHIVADMRAKPEKEYICADYFPEPEGKSAQTVSDRSPQLSLPPSLSKLKQKRHSTIEREIREMTSKMPTLDTSHLMDLVAEMPERDFLTPSEFDFGIVHTQVSDKGSKMSYFSKEEASRNKVLLKRSKSAVPPRYETLLEELEISTHVRDDPLMESELIVLKGERERIIATGAREWKKMAPGTIEFINEDLRCLIEKKKEEKLQEIEDDLPPLIQAILRNAKHDGLKEKMDEQMKELEQREKERQEQEAIQIREPTHPQPATLCSRLTDKMVVKTSDVRVSERVCMSSITLNRYATVYNDLIDEIDANTVKNMDKSLFLSEEIKEVYEEIMKTVPQDHINLDADTMIQSAPDSVDLSGILPSATLSRKPMYRVINPAFCASQDPPWGDADAKDWVKTPSDPPKNFQGEDVFPPMTPDPVKKSSTLISNENMPACVAEKLALNYSSWLHWWKSTVTSDDYMKYLSTQDTDFLAVLFHFYNSDDEEDEDEEEDPYQRPSYAQMTANTSYSYITGGVSSVALADIKQKSSKSSSQGAQNKENEQKLEELKALKNEYQKGFWNVNTVLIGGLGKDPKIEEEVPEEKPERQAELPTSITLQEKLALSKHNKLEETKSRDASRSSKRSTMTFDIKSTEIKDEPAIMTAQDRLEKVWSSLLMPDKEKLDMAIKYSSNEFFAKLSEAMDMWESITNLILEREDLLRSLEEFERKASDPNRFFEKNHKGFKKSSVIRMKEAKKRSWFYTRINRLDAEICVELETLREEFQDTVTFKGRPYSEKMKWDRIEMIYWLQEERKEHAIKYEIATRKINLKYNQLEPLQMT